VSIPDVLEPVRTTLDSMASRAGIQLEMEPTPPGLPMVRADRTRLVQILMNFGSNGIKYNRPGGKVRFEVTIPRPDAVRITIADTGMGIALEKQQKLFQPFQRAGQETGPIEGTGIGLVITKRLAELMQGAVGFSSVEGQGSKFWVEVPPHTSSARSSSRPAAPRPPEAHLTGQDTRMVLYVEDNPANVRFMEDLLGGFESIELLTAPTAEMGVELARSMRPAIIIMDINLPGMSGFDALRALRGSMDTREIPVIALTAAASERDRKRGEEAGFYRYLTKPVKVDQLEAALAAILSSKP
jgi:CheY-like chemotaxis protein